MQSSLCLRTSPVAGDESDARLWLHTFTSGVIGQTGIDELFQYLLTQWAKRCCEIVRKPEAIP